MAKKDTMKIVDEFIEFAGLQDSRGAGTPNIQMNAFSVPEKVQEVAKQYDYSDYWDPIVDPLTVISPEFLAHILIVAKEFWREND